MSSIDEYFQDDENVFEDVNIQSLSNNIQAQTVTESLSPLHSQQVSQNSAIQFDQSASQTPISTSALGKNTQARNAKSDVSSDVSTVALQRSNKPAITGTRIDYSPPTHITISR